MKTRVVRFAITLCVTSLFVPSAAHALTRLGDSTWFYLTNTLAARTDDNLFLGDLDEAKDTIIEISPGVALTFGRDGRTTGSLNLSETFSRYLEHDHLDDNLLSALLNLTYDNTRLRLDFDVSFRELNHSTRELRASTLIRRDVLVASAGAEVRITAKTAAALQLHRRDTRYQDSNYPDLRETTVPLNWFYALSEKADLGLGFRFRETSLNHGAGAGDSVDFYYNVRARGEFTTKLTGSFSIGYNRRNPDRGPDQSPGAPTSPSASEANAGRADQTSLGFEADLSYAVTEKTAATLTFGQDYTTSPEGLSQKFLHLSPAVTIQLSTHWETSVGLSFQQLEYFSGRDDSYLEARAGLTYRVNEYIALRAHFAHRANDSNHTYVDARGRDRSADFANTTIQLAAELRF